MDQHGRATYADAMTFDGHAPLNPADLAASMRPFGDSVMLPAEAYTSEEVFAWERENFFSTWLCVGRGADVAEPGMQRAEQVGSTSVLLVRGEDGELRAFANVCRHRNHEILPCGGSTKARAITCPYHAWSYKLDGELFSAAGYRDVTGFSMKNYPLHDMKVAEWGGWIFLDVTGTGGDFHEHIAGLDERVRDYAPERLVLQHKHEYVVNSNWKIINENYQECYHCPSIHPELCAVSDSESGENFVGPRGAWVGGYQDLKEHAMTMSLDGSSNGLQIPGLTDHQKRTIDYIGLFPNMLISLHPDYVMTHRMVPLAAGETWVECAWLFTPEAIAEPGFDHTFASDFWDLTNRQDFTACESVQRGLESGYSTVGVLSPQEEAVYHFITMVARGYSGQPLNAHPMTTPAQGANS